MDDVGCGCFFLHAVFVNTSTVCTCMFVDAINYSLAMIAVLSCLVLCSYLLRNW
jgi:hypothetical protein